MRMREEKEKERGGEGEGEEKKGNKFEARDPVVICKFIFMIRPVCLFTFTTIYACLRLR